MTQKIGTHSWLSKAASAAGKGLTAVGLLFGAGVLTAGCLDRPVAPAIPSTTNVYINQIRQTGVDKIDLLFMIDNSISMSDKQQILAKAVPVLVQRLITPTCVDMTGAPVGDGSVLTGADGTCPKGSNGVPEFKPIKDIHIGIVTSSLGDHGSNDVCSDAQNAENQANMNPPSFYNDLAQLLPSVRPAANLYSWNNSGFLVWDPRNQADVLDKHTPITANETNQDTFKSNFTAMVTAAGEHGCGFEASLEAWYRFLIDPEPVAKMSQTGDNPPNPVTPHNVDVRGPDPADVGDHPDKGFVHKSNIANATVLAQRAAFLRPDSLVAIVMLSDENDCSIQDEDGTQGWIVGWKGGVGKKPSFFMPRANSVCAQDPNNKCCRPCSAPGAAGCTDNSQDPVCAMPPTLSSDEDSTNERCFAQKKRFGVDLLYPTNRYSDGLKNLTIRPRFGGPEVPNPLYASVNGQPPRDSGLVFLAGIVGVPWQDISTTDSWQGRHLAYMTAQELIDNNRWQVILGDPNASPVLLPTDPFMLEQIDPRSGTNPLINEPVLPSTSTMMNKINGHEQDVPARDDLQFACIFDLGTAVTPDICDSKSDGCDCNADEFSKHSPLCQGVTMTATGSQVRAKGYPGLRELEVLREFGNNSIVASICPKNIAPAGGKSEATDPDYGYNPAVGAIVERLKEALTVKCLPRPLAPDTSGQSADPNAPDYNPDNGKVPCAVVEVRPKPQDTNGSFMACAECKPELGRTPLTGERAKVVDAAKEYLRQNGICGGTGEIGCENECFCELNQFTGTDLRACQTGGTTNSAGYCYVDPAAVDPGDTALLDGENNLVKGCQPTARRILNFVGDNIPAKDGLAFIACIGATPQD